MSFALVGLLAACSDDKGQAPVQCTNANETECNGACYDLNVDRSNCGTCGTSCGSTEVCSVGVCVDQSTVDFGVPDGMGGGEGILPSCELPKLKCGDNCIDVQSSNDNCGTCDNKCDGTKGLACSQGTCQCGTGKSECSGECTDTDSDPKNCGSCANACASGEVCNAGKCDSAGCGTLTDCSGQCVDTGSDEANCGTCANACDADKFCTNGTCACPTGQSDCNGSCTDTKTDSANCNTCGNACDAGENCIGGVCTGGVVCSLPNKQCGANCVPIQSDNSNCGDCDIVCSGAAGFSCQAGVCSCATGQTDCNGTCTNTLIDPNNCGTGAAACGVACDTAANEVCNNGVCEAQCGTGLNDCGGSCVDWQNDENNCGSCGNACAASENCNAGVCECPAGTTLCGTECVDVLTDEANCGVCGTACGAQEFCKADGLGSAACVAAEVKILTVSCAGTSATGAELICTAMATLEETAGKVDLTNDATVKWYTHRGCGTTCAGDTYSDGTTPIHDSNPRPADITCVDHNTASIAGDDDCDGNTTNGAGDTGVADEASEPAIGTGVVKGQIKIDDESCFIWENPPNPCNTYVRAVYNKGLVTVISNDLNLTVAQRQLVAVQIYPQNPVVPYLFEADNTTTGGRHLIINFVALGIYNNGDIEPLEGVAATAPNGGNNDGTFSWNSNNDTVADIRIADQAFEDGIVHLVDLQGHASSPIVSNAIPGSISAEIEVNFTPKGTTTNFNDSTTLTVVDGCAQSLTVTATPDTIPNGSTTEVDAIAAFGYGANSVNFSVTNLCTTSEPTDVYTAIDNAGPPDRTAWRYGVEGTSVLELRGTMSHVYTNWCTYADRGINATAPTAAAWFDNGGGGHPVWENYRNQDTSGYNGRSIQMVLGTDDDGAGGNVEKLDDLANDGGGTLNYGESGELNQATGKFRWHGVSTGIETVTGTFANPGSGGGLTCPATIQGQETVIINDAGLLGCTITNEDGFAGSNDGPSSADVTGCGGKVICPGNRDNYIVGQSNVELWVFGADTACPVGKEYCRDLSNATTTVWTTGNSSVAAVETPNVAAGDGQDFTMGISGSTSVNAQVTQNGATVSCSATVNVAAVAPVCVTVVPAYRGTVNATDADGAVGSHRAFREWDPTWNDDHENTGVGPTPNNAVPYAGEENERWNVLLPNLSAFSQQYRAYGWYSVFNTTCNCNNDFNTGCYAVDLTNDPNTVWDTLGLQGAGDTAAAVTASATTKGLYNVNQVTITGGSDKNVHRRTHARATYTYNGTPVKCSSTVTDPDACPELNVCGTIHYGDGPPNGTWLRMLSSFDMDSNDIVGGGNGYNNKEDGPLSTYLGSTTSQMVNGTAGHPELAWTTTKPLRYFLTQVFKSEGTETCDVTYTSTTFTELSYRLDVSEESTNCQALHPTLNQASGVASVSNAVNSKVDLTTLAAGIENGDARIRCEYASSSAEELFHVTDDLLKECKITIVGGNTRIGSLQNTPLNMPPLIEVQVTGTTENGATVDMTPSTGLTGFQCKWSTANARVECMGDSSQARGVATPGALQFRITQGDGAVSVGTDNAAPQWTAEVDPDCIQGAGDGDTPASVEEFINPDGTIKYDLNLAYTQYDDTGAATDRCRSTDTGAGEGNTEGIAVTCKGCGDPAKNYTGTGGSAGDVICTWDHPTDGNTYEEAKITVTNRVPTGIFIQTPDKTCFDAPATDMRMLETSVIDFYACITYADGTVQATDRVAGDDAGTLVNWTGSGIWDSVDGGDLNNDSGRVFIESGVNGQSSLLKVEYIGWEDTITITASNTAFQSIALVGTNVQGSSDPTGCSALTWGFGINTAGYRAPNICELAGTLADWRVVGTWADAVTQDITDNIGEIDAVAGYATAGVSVTQSTAPHVPQGGEDQNGWQVFANPSDYDVDTAGSTVVAFAAADPEVYYINARALWGEGDGVSNNATMWQINVGVPLDGGGAKVAAGAELNVFLQRGLVAYGVGTPTIIPWSTGAYRYAVFTHDQKSFEISVPSPATAGGAHVRVTGELKLDYTENSIIREIVFDVTANMDFDADGTLADHPGHTNRRTGWLIDTFNGDAGTPGVTAGGYPVYDRWVNGIFMPLSAGSTTFGAVFSSNGHEGGGVRLDYDTIGLTIN